MSGDILCALVAESGHVPFSKRVSPKIAVLSGAIAKGDDLEVVGVDGTTRAARVHSFIGDAVTPRNDDAVVALEGPSVMEIAPGDLIRRPGDPPLTLSLDGPRAEARTRLLQAAQWARAGGFPGPFAALFGRHSDEVVVLFAERKIMSALAYRGSPFGMQNAFEQAAGALQTLGLAEDGDRLLVTAAAALEGHEVGAGVRGLASAAAIGTLAVADAAEAAESRMKGFSLAMGIEMGDGFAVGYASNLRAMGEQLRKSLQAEGRAVSVGWCGKCKDAARLDERLRCETHGKRAAHVVTVIPADAEAAFARLRERHR